MKRHLVISPQQFRKCLFLYYFLPFLFLTFLGISSESKCPLLSRTRGAAKHVTEVTSLKSQAQNPDSAVALNINYTPQTLSFHLVLAPCFSCLQTCKHCLDVFCVPLPILQEKEKKLQGRNIHLTIDQREGTG